MKKINKEEFEEALIDVRRAYRLLYSYQRRLLDTMKFIADTLSRNVRSGWSVYSDSPPKDGSKLNLDTWAWDWLPMYMYEFYFNKADIGKDEIQFAIMIQSDTGPYDSVEENNWTNVELFRSPEESKTRILFQLGKNKWKSAGYHEIYDFFSSDESDVFIERGGEGQLFIAKSYPLTDVMDEDGILHTLADFISFSKSYQIIGYFNEAGVRKI